MRLFSSQRETNELVWRRDALYTPLCFTLLNKSFHGACNKTAAAPSSHRGINNDPEVHRG